MKTVLSFNISAPERGNGDGRIFNGFRVKKEKEPLEKKGPFLRGRRPSFPQFLVRKKITNQVFRELKSLCNRWILTPA